MLCMLTCDKQEPQLSLRNRATYKRKPNGVANPITYVLSRRIFRSSSEITKISRQNPKIWGALGTCPLE